MYFEYWNIKLKDIIYNKYHISLVESNYYFLKEFFVNSDFKSSISFTLAKIFYRCHILWIYLWILYFFLVIKLFKYES